jgi:hypothetical protein
MSYTADLWQWIASNLRLIAMLESSASGAQPWQGDGSSRQKNRMELFNAL